MSTKDSPQTSAAANYKQFSPGSEELVQRLVDEHAGWAISIARAVARAWNLDWQLDGLDGGAYEGLLFCARRYDPAMGVPFRAYARKRIHEASTEEARKSKSWQHSNPTAAAGREISARLLDVFPELREGLLSTNDQEGEESVRHSIKHLLASASLLAAFEDGKITNPELVVEFKQLLEMVAELEQVHQAILWAMYWNGQSMRNLAEEWGIDELAIIREHREILKHLFSKLSDARPQVPKKLKVRPGLRIVVQHLKRSKTLSPFARFQTTVARLSQNPR